MLIIELLKQILPRNPQAISFYFQIMNFNDHASITCLNRTCLGAREEIIAIAYWLIPPFPVWIVFPFIDNACTREKVIERGQREEGKISKEVFCIIVL